MVSKDWVTGKSTGNGYESTLNHQGTAGFGPFFHLPGFYFGYLFLTHTQMALKDPKQAVFL